MSWLAKLYETYGQANEHSGNLTFEERIMPVSHTIQNAHIHVVLNGEGEFLRANPLNQKPLLQIILPATEQSAGRSSGLSPHPLADKIQYVAGDYEKYGGIKKPGFDLYLAQLTAWAESEHSHEALRAVLAYVRKGCLVEDLVREGIMHERDGVLLTRWEDEEEAPDLFKMLPKEGGKLDQGGALVCWSVEIPGRSPAETWLNEEIQQSWIAFDSQNGGEPDICMVTGEKKPRAINHPAKLRHSGDKAKLVSANDSSGFTFRGRFTEAEQVNAVSFDVTQKAHNALRWLLSRQGYRTGDQVYLAWAVSGKKTPDPMDNFEDEFDFGFSSGTEPKNEAPSVDHLKDLGETYADNLNHHFAGYLGKGKLEPNEQIALIGLDSATPGRMAIIYYRETIAQEFIDTLKKWHQDLGWWQRVVIKDNDDTKGKGRLEWRICAPAPYKFLDAVYGDVLKSSESLKKNLMERLYPCIVEDRPLPVDIVNYAFERAINRVAYGMDKTWLWQQNLGIACSLYRGYCKRTANKRQQKDYKMGLDENEHSRSYLFGRLLAVANKIEKTALSISGEKRLTTAERYMTQFINRPARTWLSIRKALIPYQQRLYNRYPSYDEALKIKIQNISELFDSVADFESDKKLSPAFLLGFDTQMKWLEQHKLDKGQWVIKDAKDNAAENETESAES